MQQGWLGVIVIGLLAVIFVRVEQILQYVRASHDNAAADEDDEDD